MKMDGVVRCTQNAGWGRKTLVIIRRDPSLPSGHVPSQSLALSSQRLARGLWRENVGGNGCGIDREVCLNFLQSKQCATTKKFWVGVRELIFE